MLTFRLDFSWGLLDFLLVGWGGGGGGRGWGVDNASQICKVEVVLKILFMTMNNE